MSRRAPLYQVTAIPTHSPSVMLTPDYAAARRYAQAMMLHTGRRYVLWQVEGSRRRALGTYVPGTSPGVDDTREEEPR